MIDLPENELKKVRVILASHIPGAEVRVFGSRITGKSVKYSDLDLVAYGTERLPQKQYYQLQQAFQDSDLSIRVDLLDWYRLSPEFQENINKNYEILSLN